MILKILTLGDVVGPDAVEKIKNSLSAIRRSEKIDFVVINGENAADGGGMDIKSTEALIRSGADVVTAGNHTFKRSQIRGYLDDTREVIRPCNFPDEVSGNGYTVVTANGFKFLVMNVLGTVFMEPLACPFDTLDVLLKQAGNPKFCVVDFHAEATSEKVAMGHFLDGRVSAVWGTHTHVPTADTQILPKGTGYVTDLGMTGPKHSVLGIRPDLSIAKFRGDLTERYRWADGPTKLEAVLFTIDTDTGLCRKAERVDLYD